MVMVRVRVRVRVRVKPRLRIRIRIRLKCSFAIFSVPVPKQPSILGRRIVLPGNTKGGSITVSLTSCLTGLESAV
jgi:hypothetical protein